MYRANDSHGQRDMFDTTTLMNPKTLGKLEKSWAAYFYEHVFC